MCIIEAKSIIQKQKCNQKNFSDVAELLFSSFFIESGPCQRINIIFDVYWDNSIKTLKDLARVVQHQQLLSKAFLEATRLNNDSRLSKDQETRWSLFVFCAKSGGSCITDQNFSIGACICLMNKNVGC